MRAGVILMTTGMAALVVSVTGYTFGCGSFGTAAAVIALASVGIGLGTLNDLGRSSSSR
jgi:hypothetical protein